MGKYTDEEVYRLIESIDALDVLELIDFHPESIKREGNEVKAFCPLCQDTTERYLTVDLATKTFVSESPNLPTQQGTIVDLFTRALRLEFDAAVERLADEFGVLLMEPDEGRGMEDLLAEAELYLVKAQQPGGGSGELAEAEKRFTRVLLTEPEHRRALFGMMRIRTLEKNPLTLTMISQKLLNLEKRDQRWEAVAEVAGLHLDALPMDLQMRRERAEALRHLGRTPEAVAEWIKVGETADQGGMVNEAIEAYQRAHQIDPETETAHLHLLRLYSREGRTDAIYEQIEKRIDRLKRAKRFHEASREAIRKLEFNRDDDEARLQSTELAILAGIGQDELERSRRFVREMIDGGRLAPAAEVLAYLTAERPNDTGLLELLADVYTRLGEEEMAEEMTYRLAELYREGGKLAEAKKLLERKLEENSQDLRALESLALVQLAEGEKHSAIALLSEVADLALQNMDDEGALGPVRKITEVDPTLWEERDREVDLLWVLGRRGESETALERLVADLREAGERDRILPLLEHQLKRDPHHLASLKSLFELSEEMGDRDRCDQIRRKVAERLAEEGAPAGSRTLLENFHAIDPANPAVLRGLIDVYTRDEEAGKAREAILKLAQVHRDEGSHEAERKLLVEATSRFPRDLDLLKARFRAEERAEDEPAMMEVAAREMALLETGSQYAAALAKAAFVLEREPANTDALAVKARVSAKIGKRAEAREARWKLAEVFATMGNEEARMAVLREAVEADPRDPESLLRLINAIPVQQELELAERATAYLSLVEKDPAARLAFLEDITARAPRLVPLQLRLIDVYKERRDRDRAVAATQHAIETLEALADQDQLIELYRDLLEMRPDNFMAHERLITLLHDKGRHAECLAEHLRLARAYRAAGMLHEAATAYEKMYTVDPENTDLLRDHAALLRERGQAEAAHRKERRLAEVLSDRGMTTAAVELLRELVRQKNDDLDARRLLVDQLRTSERFEEAVEHLDAIARRHQQSNDWKLAIQARREAVAMLPSALELREQLVADLHQAGLHSEALAEQLELAENLSRHGQPQRALTVIETLLQDSPDMLKARQLRAQIYDGMGDEKRALAEYREMQQYVTNAGYAPAAAPVALADDDEEFAGLQIMEDCVFDTFIVGSRNSFAYATAKAVAAKPGASHNPLFLYADVGLGKTHLLHAIANHLRAERPAINILYASTEYFTSALIDAIQSNQVMRFRNRYRRADLLLLDDVQFLAGKERSQEEFFHIFNILHQDGRQIVVTSDRPPKDIAHLDARIRSRFGQGVIVDIQSPDLETRTAILRAEATRRGIDPPDDAIAVIAERVNSNVRELKGAFNQLLTQFELLGDEMSAATANVIVDKFFAT